MTTTPLAADFANLLAARRLFTGQAAHLQPDYARQRVARWIANVSSPLTAEMEICGAIRRFTPATRQRAAPIFYLHGGGLVYYSTGVFSSFLATLAQISGREVWAFDYPKAPETPMGEIVSHLEQQLAVALELVEMPPCLMGDSIGGLLAIWFSSGRFSHSFSQLHLLYPVLANHQDFDSYQRYGEGYLLDAEIMRWFAGHWLPWCRQQQFDPLAQDFSFGQLPAVVLHTAGYDVLADEGVAFAHLARMAGAPLQQHHHPTLPHDFCLYAGKLSSARQAVEQIARALNIDNELTCTQ
ncbi:alpha/beta hydrolase [Salmonella enterica]|nr:alpha/beta hydrolase [Salmonella enterica]